MHHRKLLVKIGLNVLTAGISTLWSRPKTIQDADLQALSDEDDPQIQVFAEAT